MLGSTYAGLKVSGWFSSHFVMVFALVRSSVVMFAREAPGPVSRRSVVAMSGGVTGVGQVWSRRERKTQETREKMEKPIQIDCAM